MAVFCFVGGVLGLSPSSRVSLAQPAACPVPPAPPPPQPKGEPANVHPEDLYGWQELLDKERAKPSGVKYSTGRDEKGVGYERTEYTGGDKTKPSPSELLKAQIRTNKETEQMLRSNETQKTKDAFIRNAVARKVRNEDSLTYSDKKELNREFNIKNMPPDQKGKTISCLGKSCGPDLGERDVWAKKDDLAGFFNRNDRLALRVQPPGEQSMLLADLNDSAKKLRNRLIETALDSKDPEARRAAASLIPPPNFDPNAAFAKRLASATGDENAKMHMKHLGDLLRAKHLGSEPRWKAYVDSAGVDRKIITLLGDKNVIRDLQKLRDDANNETKQSWQYGQQVAYVRSDDFWKRLQLLPEAEAKKIVAEEIGKIAIVDPDEARDALGQLQDRATAKLIDEMSDDDLIKRLSDLETHLGGHGAVFGKALKGGVDLAKRGAKVSSSLEGLKALIKARASRGASPQDAIRKFEEGFAGTQLGKSLAWLATTDQHGKMSGRSAGLGLLLSGVDLANGDLGNGTKKDVDAVLSVMKAADAYDAFAKWGAWQASIVLTKESAIIVKLAPLKALGPAADLIGAVVDTTRGINNLDAGNAEKGYWQLTAAGGQIATAAGTIVILAGASGPAAPVVVLVGTMVVVIAKIGEAYSSKLPEVEFLRETELLAPTPKEVSTHNVLKESLKSHQRDLGIFKRNLNQANNALAQHDSRIKDRALDAKYRALAGIDQEKAAIARYEIEIEANNAKMAEMQINPSDWDGFSASERRDRAERAAKARIGAIKHAESIENARRMGAPLGR